MTTYKDQALIVAVDMHGAAFVLAALGEKAQEGHEGTGPSLEDLGFDEDDHPRTPGVHVWEGGLAIDRYDDGEGFSDTSYEWEGNWRPATQADFANFGLLRPETTL